MDSHITKITAGMLWLLLVAVLTAPLVYVMASASHADFLDNVMSGLLATAAALIGGIPIALWIDRAIKYREEKKQKETEKSRELELLELIKEELDFTNSLLDHRHKNPGNFFIQPLKSDLWHAISSAGKLNLINNHRLLNRIASAYYLVDTVKKIEEQGYKAMRGATVSFSNGKTASQMLWEDARGFDKLLSDSIQEAKKEIDRELNKETSENIKTNIGGK